jgi:hypothetical protein
MMESNLHNPLKRGVRGSLLTPIIFLWSLCVLAAFMFFWIEDGFKDAFNTYYLVPWTLFAGIVVLAPSIYLFYIKKFDPFHPLIFATWIYIFPAFVLGSVILTLGWSDPYFLSFIDDPQYNIPLTLMYVTVGFMAMTVGYFLPVGKYFAEKVELYLPKWKWDISEAWGPGILLLLAGVGFNILGFIQGLLGYQRVDEISIFDGLLSFLLILLNEGTILLWLTIFSTKKKTGIYYIVLAVLILFLPLRMAMLGSRSSLLVSIIPIAMAFQYSGRRLKWQHTALFGVILSVAVFIGIIYGTSFRNIKGSEARVNAGDYIGQIGATLDYLSTEDPTIVIEQGAKSLAERIENLSSLAVVVANYEKLAPYESSYGLENNIVNDLLTSFIPRFVWTDKPQTSDARAYSDLYFNYSENSFAISPFGDLLRNFGPIGVPLGMLVLGIYLRLLYACLIETPYPAAWKKIAYFPLLTVVSYEAFYATIFPSIIRTCFVLIISLLLVNLIIKSKGRSV